MPRFNIFVRQISFWFSCAFAALFWCTPNVVEAQHGTTRLKVLAINTIIGGSTAAISAAIHRRPIRPAIINGSAGGAVVFAGKCLIAQKHHVTDWIGQETVAIGSSVVANAETGRSPLSRIVFPVGPLRFYRDNSSGSIHVKVDLVQTGVAAYYAAQPHTNVDWRSSARHDALILYDRNAPTEYEVAGVIKTWNTNSSMLVHEEIHVAQDQFVTTALEDPIEGALLKLIPGGKTVHRYFNLGIVAPFWAAANGLISTSRRPWEREAVFFADYC